MLRVPGFERGEWFYPRFTSIFSLFGHLNQGFITLKLIFF